MSRNGSAIIVQGANIRVVGNRVAQQQKFALPGRAGIALVGVGLAVDLCDNTVAGFGTGIDVSCTASGLVVSRNIIEVTSGGLYAITIGSHNNIVSEVVIENNVVRNGGIMALGPKLDHRTAILRNNVFFGARGLDVPCVNTSSATVLLADSGNVCT